MRPRFVTLFLAAILALALIPGPVALAHDDATPQSGDVDAMPVEIHAGSCGHYELDGVIALTALTQPQADPAAEAVPAALSLSTITASREDLMESPHVVVVHMSAATMDQVLACGAIGGQPGPDGLAVRLDAVSTTEPATGVAWLTSSDGQTQVAVFLSPETPRAAAIEVPVTLGDGDEFAIDSAMTSFQQGQLYRFVVTNEGALPHEFVIGPSLNELAGSRDDDQAEGDMHAGDDMHGDDMHMEEDAVAGADHELVHQSSVAVIEADDLPPGATVAVDVVFDEPAEMGELEFGCHVPGHYDAGMFLPIEVIPNE
jgi:uncharacterized cupredoxin-like copper-binding protein